MIFNKFYPVTLKLCMCWYWQWSDVIVLLCTLHIAIDLLYLPKRPALVTTEAFIFWMAAEQSSHRPKKQRSWF